MPMCVTACIRRSKSVGSNAFQARAATQCLAPHMWQMWGQHMARATTCWAGTSTSLTQQQQQPAYPLHGMTGWSRAPHSPAGWTMSCASLAVQHSLHRHNRLADTTLWLDPGEIQRTHTPPLARCVILNITTPSKATPSSCVCWCQMARAQAHFASLVPLPSAECARNLGPQVRAQNNQYSSL